MPNVILNAYNSVKATVYTLAEKTEKLPLAAPETLSISPVYISDELGCELNPDALEQSIDQARKSRLYVKVGKAALLVGAACLLPSGFYGLSAYMEHGFHPNARWITPTFIASGLSALLIVGGFSVVRAETSRAHRPLDSFKYAGFLTAAMKDRFEAFKAWGLETRPKLYIALSEGRFIALSDEVWANINLPVILFGSDEHRRYLLSPQKYILSSLVMNKNDWDDFPFSMKEPKQPKPPEVSDAETNLISDETLLSEPTRPFTLRQKARGEHTKWCPRLEMFCSDLNYFLRYKGLDLNINSISARRQACHRALRYFANNPQSVKIFFRTGRIEPDQIERAAEIDKQVKRELRVEGVNVSSSFNSLKKMKWPVMEKHIESTQLISDQKLVNTYPELKSYWESQSTN